MPRVTINVDGKDKKVFVHYRGKMFLKRLFGSSLPKEDCRQAAIDEYLKKHAEKKSILEKYGKPGFFLRLKTHIRRGARRMGGAEPRESFWNEIGQQMQEKKIKRDTKKEVRSAIKKVYGKPGFFLKLGIRFDRGAVRMGGGEPKRSYHGEIVYRMKKKGKRNPSANDIDVIKLNELLAARDVNKLKPTTPVTKSYKTNEVQRKK